MKAVIFDASDKPDQEEAAIIRALEAEFERGGHSCRTFTLRDTRILPCRSCVACSFESPGQCVQKDDAHELLRAVVNAGVLVIVTPLRFGGYPSQLKKALDRFMVLGLPLYTVKKGRMLHPMRYAIPRILTIGLARDRQEQRDNVLEMLARRNAANMGTRYKCLVLDRSKMRARAGTGKGAQA